MKNILLVLFVFLISCSTDSENITDCKCDKVVYKHTIVNASVIPPTWGYEYQYTETDYSFECDDSTNDYNYMGDNLYYKVICE